MVHIAGAVLQPNSEIERLQNELWKLASLAEPDDVVESDFPRENADLEQKPPERDNLAAHPGMPHQANQEDDF